MNDQDRTSIHESMEQQSISISKAGIVTSLQARCSVIAAANPIYGKYNAAVPFSANVELTEPILSRFDVLCVVRDLADPVKDEHLARFVLASHARCHPDATVAEQRRELEATDPDIIPQDILRKYIMYARDRTRPSIADVDGTKLERLYAELRRESMVGTGSIPITVRYLESIVRMSEAFARMHLRDHVRQDDIDAAIAVCIRSFVSAQKQSAKKALGRVFDKYVAAFQDQEQLLLHVLGEMEREVLSMSYYKTADMPGSVALEVEDLEMRVSCFIF
jgi:DNA replication licensing factor MCM2